MIETAVVHITIEQLKAVADVAIADINSNVEDPEFAELLKGNLKKMQDEMNKPEDKQDGAQFILYDHCQLEHEIVKGWMSNRLDATIAAGKSMINEEWYLPLMYAARLASIMWRFPFKYIHDDNNSGVARDHLLVDNLKLAGSSKEPESNPTATNARRESSKVPRAKHMGFIDAPPSSIAFPGDLANLTVVEILCYFPGWITSRDVINRILCNGGGPTKVAKIMMEYRNIPQTFETLKNTLVKKLNRHMRPVHGDKWISRKHEIPEDHDKNTINVSSFKTVDYYESGDNSPSLISSIAFKDLKKGTIKTPSGSDALDLTRCVEYAVAHPDENWMFPEDFANVLKHVGGPSQVIKGNLDKAIFHRYEHAGGEKRKRRGSVADVANSSEKNAHAANGSIPGAENTSIPPSEETHGEGELRQSKRLRGSISSTLGRLDIFGDSSSDGLSDSDSDYKEHD